MTETMAPADPTAAALQELAAHLAALGAPVILCLGCTVERVQAAQRGTPEAELPPVDFAALIVNGTGQCLRHVQFTDRPVVPGQTPSGLVLPGRGM